MNFKRVSTKFFLRVRKEEENLKDARLRKLQGSTAIFQPPYSFEPAPTAVPRDALEKIGQSLTTIPENFNVNPKVRRQFDEKWSNFLKGTGVDWGFAEALAFGSLYWRAHPSVCPVKTLSAAPSPTALGSLRY